MSWWVSLNDVDDNTLKSNVCVQEGGTQCVGGTTDAMLNITYNYSPGFYLTIDSDKGLDWLHGKRGCETAPKLDAAVKALGTKQHEDYWVPTFGNTGYALSILARWAHEFPDGTWKVH